MLFGARLKVMSRMTSETPGTSSVVEFYRVGYDLRMCNKNY